LRVQENGIQIVPGGICAPKGFTASGVHCGIRKNQTKKDLALIVSEQRASAAAVYTQNRVQGAPLTVTRENLTDGYARAVICNSGIANTCSAGGMEAARAMCALVAEYTGIPAEDVIVASTGVIGQPLPLGVIQSAMPALTAALSADGEAAAQAILTTDTMKKESAVEFQLGGKICRLGGIAKGSGMIHPNMATLLSFLTTDAAVSPEMLQKALSDVVKDSYNMISVDGDTSTNDMVTILANGMAGNAPITAEGEDYQYFVEALSTAAVHLSRVLARDGEGATKLLECRVSGAADEDSARAAAKAVIASNLLKAAMFGADANWGRVLCALGYGAPEAAADQADVSFASAAGEIMVCQNGMGLPFDEATAKQILLEQEIQILIELHSGDCGAAAWGCDLTYDYVKINGDYRS